MFNLKIINKNNLINNIKQVRQRNPNSMVCAMVKANAYGVGLKEVVKILSPYADFFGVACFCEAEAVKKLCTNRILIVGPLEYAKVDPAFSFTCQSLEDVNFLVGLNRPLRVHLKVNSGMNRFGFKSPKEFKLALTKIKNSLLFLEGVFTHFATADEYVNKQMQKFKKFVKICKDFGFNPLVHADNSLVNEKFNHHLDMVRIGFDLYNNDNKIFKPVLEIESTIVKINKLKKGELAGYDYRFQASSPTKIAVVPIGYADGFDMRFLGLKLSVNKKMCKVVNICMDCFMLDITKCNFKVGDKIKILNSKNSLKKYSKKAKTTIYEVGTRFGSIRAKTKIK